MFSFSVFVRLSAASHSRSRSRHDGEPFRSTSSRQLGTFAMPLVPAMLPAELAYLRALADARSPFVSSSLPRVMIHPSLGVYAADLLAQARHHVQLAGGLLSARAHAAWPALARALRVLRGDASGALLVRAALAEVRSVVRDAASGVDTYVGAGPGEPVSAGAGEADALLGGATLREEGGWMHISGGKRVGAPSEHDSAAEQAAIEPLDVWEVSDEEIRTVLPAVMRHRLRVRDRPEDEVLASLMFQATASVGGSSCAPPDHRRTVDAILKDILDNVDVGIVP
jgi:hypothetical protein